MRLRTSILPLFFALGQPAIAGSEKATFELVGTLVPGEPGMFRTVYPTISLHSIGTPFSARAVANVKGEFKLKRLQTGMYTLVAVLPQVRVLRKTVDIGPSFADAKGKIYVTIPFDRLPPNRLRYTVSASQLAIPDGAMSEYRKAQDYLANGDSERGIACLKKIVETTPQFASAWNSLGSIASQSGHFEEAEIYYKESLNHNPSSYRTLLSLGGTLISQKKTKEGLQVFVRAVKASARGSGGPGAAGLDLPHARRPGQGKGTPRRSQENRAGTFLVSPAIPGPDSRASRGRRFLNRGTRRIPQAPSGSGDGSFGSRNASSSSAPPEGSKIRIQDLGS